MRTWKQIGFRARAVAMVMTIFFMIGLAFRQQAEQLRQAPLLVSSPATNVIPADPTLTTETRTQSTVPAYLTIGVDQYPSYLKDDLASRCPGYVASDIRENDFGVAAELTLSGTKCNAYGTDFEKLTLEVEYQSDHRIRIKIADAKRHNFDLSQRPDIYNGQIYRSQKTAQHPEYEFSYNASPFEFWITRSSDEEILFDTRGHKLVFEDQYLQLTTRKVPDANIYGLGDVIHTLRMGDNYTRTLYAADIGDIKDANLYGSHPFYMEHRYHDAADDGHATHGVLLMTSNNMDVLIRPEFLQYRVTGGVLDLFVYTGPSPLSVVEQYVESIGLPSMQSYWTLGFHQCRWGYSSTAETKEVVDKYREADIPLETIWNDIDYMLQYRDWTLDPNFLDLGDFVDNLHEMHQHYIPIVDAAIYASNPENRSEDDYHPYYSGLDRDTFLRNPDGSIYYGAVWPGYTAFPDWLAKNTTSWWHESMQNFFETLTTYDGIWLDMNEVSSFCVGSCGSGRLQDNQVHPPFSLPGETSPVTRRHLSDSITEMPAKAARSIHENQQHALKGLNVKHEARAAISRSKLDLNYPSYAINNRQGNGDLAYHAVSPNATHQDGTLEYDVHNLFGWGETVATYTALQKIRPNERPFIISRSTFPGSGTMAGHWGGDNYSKWLYMYYSIPQALSFQIFGIPMVGPDTCGFSGNTDEELCSRWMQLSAFFPFYRNHNTLNAQPQEAYVWPAVASATKTAMNIRYLMLPYWYTLFEEAHRLGTPVIRALFMEFPNDQSLAAVDRQFMVGNAIMIIPVLEPGRDYIQGVFPGIADGEVWYDWYTHLAVKFAPQEAATISAPIGHIPVYLRGGIVLPLQVPGYTTTESRQNAWRLLIALATNGTAQGRLYQDDGISEHPLASTRVSFTVEHAVLSVRSVGTYAVSQPLELVTVLGVDHRPAQVRVGTQVIPEHDWKYDSKARTLAISSLEQYTSHCGAFSGSECPDASSKQKSQWTISWS